MSRGQFVVEPEPVAHWRAGEAHCGKRELHCPLTRDVPRVLPSLSWGASALRAWRRLRRHAGACTRRNQTEVHPRRRPATGVHELDVFGGEPIPVGNGARVETEGVAAGSHVGEGELPRGVGRRDHPVFGPDVDVGEASLAGSLHPVPVRIHPDLPDRGARLHRPGAADLNPRDRFGRAGQSPGDLACRHSPRLGNGARRGDQSGHVAKCPARAWRERGCAV